MGASQRRKGAAFEADIVGYLRRFFPAANRLRVGTAHVGAGDRGDIGGVPGMPVIELKNCKQTDLSGWWRETLAEMENAATTRGVLIHKRRGVSDPAEQWVTMPLWMLVDLLGADVSQVRAS